MKIFDCRCRLRLIRHSTHSLLCPHVFLPKVALHAGSHALRILIVFSAPMFSCQSVLFILAVMHFVFSMCCWCPRTSSLRHTSHCSISTLATLATPKHQLVSLIDCGCLCNQYPLPQKMTAALHSRAESVLL